MQAVSPPAAGQLPPQPQQTQAPPQNFTTADFQVWYILIKAGVSRELSRQGFWPHVTNHNMKL